MKMIALDLDGTLLRTDKSISENTKKCLEKCRARGIKVIYATGRGGSAEARAPAHMFDGRALMNGAIAYDGSEEVYRRLVPVESARELLMACDRRGLKTTAELCGMHYSNFDVSAEWSDIRNFEIVDFAEHGVDAEKLYAIVERDADVEFIERHMPPGLYLTVSRDGLAQIMHTEATKLQAIRALAARWGIEMSEVVAFGDDLNDVNMLRGCGTGVAMANALDEVKLAADEVCGGNDEDGVAKWIEANMQ